MTLRAARRVGRIEDRQEPAFKYLLGAGPISRACGFRAVSNGSWLGYLCLLTRGSFRPLAAKQDEEHDQNHGTGNKHAHPTPPALISCEMRLRLVATLRVAM